MSKSTTKTETVQAADLVLRPEVTKVVAWKWDKDWATIHRVDGCIESDQGKDWWAPRDRKWAEKALAEGTQRFCKRCAVITPAKAEAMVAKRAAKEAARREGAKVSATEHGTVKVGKNRTEYDAIRNTETGEVTYTDSKGEVVPASKTATKTFKARLDSNAA